jgi:AAA domain/PLD-like domain
MLRSERSPWQPGDHPRIIVVAPYRAHARLLGLMLREQKLEGEVEAGTVHNFQGSEAPVVIFDTVVDEPHWRVNLFMPSINEEMRRLLNVAITRAQSRLVLVGDFPYIHKQAKKAVLNDLIEMAEKRGSKVEAMAVLQVGLSARAARAQSLTEGSLKEDREAGRMVTTQEAFFGKLIQDLAAAEDRVIIYSPFMTQGRVGQLAPHIKAAIERGIRVYVITKAATLEERNRLVEAYRQIEAALTDWGVVVAHKRNMHEKVVLIDDKIVWTGSLNTLSFSDTQEVMERRRSTKIAADYIKTLRVNELLEPFDAGEANCPVCNAELVASEGNDEPFFWRCITPDCHSRSIGDRAPKDGRIICRNCGEAVEFMDMPSGPHWRCIENKHHRQRVVKNHLKLPKMREIVARRDLKKLDQRFGLDDSNDDPKSKKPASNSTQLQLDTVE